MKYFLNLDQSTPRIILDAVLLGGLIAVGLLCLTTL